MAARKSKSSRAKRGIALPVPSSSRAMRGIALPVKRKFKDSADNPEWVAPEWDDELLLGAHVSVAGGSQEGPRRAKSIGASAMQIFTKMANRWAERVCADDECVGFRKALRKTNVRATIAHDSYLINLASPDATLRRQSIESFAAE